MVLCYLYIIEILYQFSNKGHGMIYKIYKNLIEFIIFYRKRTIINSMRFLENENNPVGILSGNKIINVCYGKYINYTWKIDNEIKKSNYTCCQIFFYTLPAQKILINIVNEKEFVCIDVYESSTNSTNLAFSYDIYKCASINEPEILINKVLNEANLIKTKEIGDYKTFWYSNKLFMIRKGTPIKDISIEPITVTGGEIIKYGKFCNLGVIESQNLMVSIQNISKIVSIIKKSMFIVYPKEIYCIVTFNPKTLKISNSGLYKADELIYLKLDKKLILPLIEKLSVYGRYAWYMVDDMTVQIIKPSIGDYTDWGIEIYNINLLTDKISNLQNDILVISSEMNKMIEHIKK